MGYVFVIEGNFKCLSLFFLTHNIAEPIRKKMQLRLKTDKLIAV